MRKFIYVIVAPLVTIILLVVKFPNVEEKLNSFSTSSMIYVQIFLVAATALTYYVTMYSPYAKYEKLAKKRWLLIQVYAERLQQQYKEYVINFNIMVPKTKYFYFIEPTSRTEPKKKFTFKGKVFKVVWCEGEGVNRKLKITTNQGACGKAYSQGRIFSADYTGATRPFSNFNEDQEGLITDLKFVISFPLVSADEQIDHVNNKVQGVLNIESTTPGSESLIKDAVKSVTFYKEVFEFRKICAKLLR